MVHSNIKNAFFETLYFSETDPGARLLLNWDNSLAKTV